MGNANVAFTDVGGPTGTRFPEVSEFEDQQQYPASQTRPGQSFENIVGECSLLERMPKQAVIAATYDSFVRHQGEPTIASDTPLANLGRILGLLAGGSGVERPYNADEIQFLSQVACQIANAIDRAPASQGVLEQGNMLAEEKLCLEEEFRSGMGFERIIGSSPALKHVSAVGRNRRAQRFHGSFAWRNRHGKGTDRPRHPRTQSTQGPHVCETKLRRHSHWAA